MIASKPAFRLHLILITLFLSSSFLALGQTTTWLGIDSTWSNIANWSNGVPDGTQGIIIPVTSINPTSNVSLIIPSDDTLVVNEGATLTIYGNCAPARALSIAGYAYNHGTINIPKWNSYGITMTGDKFVNAETGVIRIDSTLGGLENYNGDGTIENFGLVEITNSTFSAILNDNEFINHGDLLIDKAGNDGIRNGFSVDNAVFINHSFIDIEDCGQEAIHNNHADTFINKPCATISTHFNDSIIDINNSFNNEGTIVERSNGTSNVASNTGRIYNLFGGAFNIGSGNAPLTAIPDTFIWTGGTDTCWYKGCNWSAGLAPDGGYHIAIPQTANQPSVKGRTVRTNTSKSLIIDSNVVLNIDGLNKIIVGIRASGKSMNYGEINIKNTIEDGLLASTDTFCNAESGFINIYNTGYGLYTNGGGTFWNKGEVYLTNQQYEAVDNPGVLINEGYLKAYNAGGAGVYTNSGAIMNKGIIDLNKMYEGMYFFNSQLQNYGFIFIDTTNSFSISTNGIDTCYNAPCALIQSYSEQPIRDADSNIVNDGAILCLSPDSSNIHQNNGLIEIIGGGVFHATIDNGLISTSSSIEGHLQVISTADDGPGTLRQLVDCAKPGDTLRYHSSTKNQSTFLTSGEIEIDKKLTICGIDTFKNIISGKFDDANRLFFINTFGNVTFKNIDLIEGGGASFNSNGGGILNLGSLKLSNCYLTANMTDGNGGAVYSGGSLYAKDVKFDLNESVLGGAIYMTGTFMDLFNTNVVENNSDQGGAIYIGDYVIAEFYGCSISSNSRNDNTTFDHGMGGEILINEGTTIEP